MKRQKQDEEKTISMCVYKAVSRAWTWFWNTIVQTKWVPGDIGQFCVFTLQVLANLGEYVQLDYSSLVEMVLLLACFYSMLVVLTKYVYYRTCRMIDFANAFFSLTYVFLLPTEIHVFWYLLVCTIMNYAVAVALDTWDSRRHEGVSM